MSQNLEKWLKLKGKESTQEQEENKYLKELINFSKEEIQRFLDPDFVAKINSSKLGLILLLELKKETIEKPLKRDIEKREDKVRFLEEVEKEIKKSIEKCKKNSKIKDKKIKEIRELLLNFVEKEKKLEKDMKKQGYGDKDFLRPFK